MSFDMIPLANHAVGSQIPAHLKLGRAATEEIEGLDGNVLPFKILGFSGKQLVIKDGNEMTEFYPPWLVSVVAVAKMNGRLVKHRRFYDGPYDPEAPQLPPDCSSKNSIYPDKPDTAVSQVCATCPNSVFGSAIDSQGAPGKGQRCAQVVRLVVRPWKNLPAGMEDEPFILDLPPTSHKKFQEGMKAGMNAMIAAGGAGALHHGVWKLSFAMQATFPMLMWELVGTTSPAMYEDLEKWAGSRDVIGLTTIEEPLMRVHPSMIPTPHAVSSPSTRQQAPGTVGRQTPTAGSAVYVVDDEPPCWVVDEGENPVHESPNSALEAGWGQQAQAVPQSSRRGSRPQAPSVAVSLDDRLTALTTAGKSMVEAIAIVRSEGYQL